VVDDDFVCVLYRTGEYRIVTKRGGYFYLFRATTCDRRNYAVQVDARWDPYRPGSGYGLIFGLSNGFNQYYLFDVTAFHGLFRLLRRDAGGVTVLVPPTRSAAINGSPASSHLKATRNGDQITLEVNGTLLGTWFDGKIGGLTGTGLVTNPYYRTPDSAVLFDNFSMFSLPGAGASAQRPSGVTAEEDQLAPRNARRVPVPTDMEW
jgi:hypothetical protein